MQKTKIEPPSDLESQLLGIYPKDKKSSLFRRYLPPTVSAALIHSNPDVESACESIRGRPDETLVSHKRKKVEIP